MNGKDVEQLALSILAQIILPKNQYENVCGIMKKLQKEKISSVILNKELVSCFSNHPILLECFNLLNGKKKEDETPFLLLLFKIIRLFLSNKQPKIALFSFIKLLISVSNGKKSKIELFACHVSILDQESSFYCSLLDFSLSFLKICPKMYHLNEEFNEYRPFNLFFDKTEIPKYDLPSLIQKKKEISPESSIVSKYSSSYIVYQVPIPNDVSCIFLNAISKSIHSGREGLVSTYLTQSVKLISELHFYMSNYFEELVVSDQEFLSFLNTGEDDDIYRKGRIRSIYGNRSYEVLRVPISNTSSIVNQRSHQLISQVFERRYKASVRVHEMTNHIPPFNYNSSIHFNVNHSEITYIMPKNTPVITRFLKNIARKQSDDLFTFLNTVLPLFISNDSRLSISIIGTDAIFNALFLTLKTIECLYNIFYNSKYEETDMMGIIRYAECEAVLKHTGNIDNTTEDFLEDFIKLFFSGSLSFNDMLFEAEVTFGTASYEVIQLLVYLSQLIPLCIHIGSQKIIPSFESISRIFGFTKSSTPDKVFKSRFPMYFQFVRSRFLKPLVNISIKGQKCVATPL